mgnify:CR=1 FL=1|tara:strand:- start:2303 stop:2527 length:225 start_codon:yes stop_codon:yes gene_type:complete
MAYEYPAATIINDTSAVTGRFGKIVALNDTVIATIVAENIDGDLTAINLDATGEICGVITGITLTSGTVIAYRL